MTKLKVTIEGYEFGTACSTKPPVPQPVKHHPFRRQYERCVIIQGVS